MEGSSNLLNPIKEVTFSSNLLPLQSFVTETNTHAQEDLAVSTASKGGRPLGGVGGCELVVFAETLGEGEIKLCLRKAAPWSYLALHTDWFSEKATWILVVLRREGETRGSGYCV